MSMDKSNDRESHDKFWSSFFQSLADSEPKFDFFPKISSPILVMSTSMAIDILPDPLQAPGDGDKNINEDGGKSNEKEIEKENENGAKDEMTNVGKRPRSNEACIITEKRRRTNLRTKLENPNELTSSSIKEDKASTLDFNVENIRSTKLYVEENVTMQNQNMYPMLPLGMGMYFPTPWFRPFRAPPWFPYIHPNFYMPPPFNDYTPGETSTHNNQLNCTRYY